MPSSAQTPASKRFLSSSSSYATVPAQTNPSSSFRTPQFARPSQPFSSSPFLRTPFGQKSHHEHIEEIETSFEDADPAPGHTISALSKPSRPSLPEGDSIEDNELPLLTSTAGVHGIVSGQSRAPYEDLTAYPQSESSPAPKRRKIFQTTHTSPSNGESGQVLSILGSSPEGRLVANQKHGENLAEGDSDLEAVDRDGADHVRTPHTKSRFQPPSIYSDSPMPSMARPNFLSSLTASARGHFPLLESTLPDAFSPSRRKGKADYIRGGAAETVRKWVIDLASEQSRVVRRSDGGQIICVESAAIDKSRRFVTVVATSGETWMLINQHERESSGIDTIKTGSKIALKGSDGSQWSLTLQHGVDALFTSEKDVHQRWPVAVLWELIERQTSVNEI